MTDNPNTISPLYSQDAEESLLGAVFIDPQLVHQLAGFLVPTDFYFLQNQFIYEACINLVQRGEDVDIVSVEFELRAFKHAEVDRGHLIYLATNFATALHAMTYARIVKHFAVRRMGIGKLQKIHHELSSEDLDVNEALTQAQQILNEAFQSVRVSTVRTQAEVVSDYYDHVMDIQAGNGQPRLKTGIVDLDHKLGGGFGHKWFVVVSAPSGGGKTTLMMQVAINVAQQGGKVMVISREMSDEELEARIITQKSGLSSGEQQSKMDEKQLRRFVNASGNVAGLPIFYDCTAATMTQIKASVLRTHQAHGLSLVVIDYIQIVDPSDCNGYNREQEVAYISRMCKMLSAELGVTVIAGSQQNDNGKVRESRAIRNDADLLLQIDSNEEDPAEQGSKMIFFDKFRHGPDKSNVEGGGVRLYYDPNLLYFGDLVRKNLNG